MAHESQNPLISTNEASRSGLQVLLHPLALLTISDYLTRHALNKIQSPIAGVLLGRQDGRDLSIEYAFECPARAQDEQLHLQEDVLQERLQQYKDVHRAPAIDLVGWFTAFSRNGPPVGILPAHEYILRQNESALLLAFHPSEVRAPDATGKLPVTIYETVQETEAGHPPTKTNESEEEDQSEPLWSQKFLPIEFTVDSGEAETIAIDFAATGAGHASKRANTLTYDGTQTQTQPGLTNGGPASQQTRGQSDTQSHLSPEDEDLIASLRTRANAVRMMKARLNLLRTYCQSYPNIRTSDSSTPSGSGKADPADASILRAIQTLTKRMEVVAPTDREAFLDEISCEYSDAALAQLLNMTLSGSRDLSRLNRKFTVVNSGAPPARTGKQGGGSRDVLHFGLV